MIFSMASSSSPPPPIPNDVIVEILSWLSVSSLMRFRWACKYWFDLITRDHAFSKLHLLHQHHHQEEINYDHDEFINNNNNNTSLLIFTSPHRAYNIKCNNVVFRQLASTETVLKMDFYDLFLPVTTDTDGVTLRTMFLGSCNGLICFHRFSYSIDVYFLWNPSTRELKELPQPPNNISCTRTTPNPKLVVHGFGYDHTIDDYKVIRNVYYHGVGMMKNNIYTLGSNSWHTKNETVLLFEDDIMKDISAGLFANGALHWMIFPKLKARIIAFDITKEEHGEIHCPEFFSWFCSKLRVLNGSLWVLQSHPGRNSTVDVWIMKDYGVKESWTKSFTINLETLISVEVSTRLLHPVKYFKDSGILMLYDHTCLVAAYDTKKCKIRYIQKIEDNNFKKFTKAVVTYVESLVSLDSGVFLTPDGSTTTTVVQVQEGEKDILLRSASGAILYLTDQQEQPLFKYIKEKKEPTSVAQVQEGEKETLLRTDSGKILTLTDQEEELLFKYMKEKMKEKREPTTTTTTTTTKKKRPRIEEETKI